MYQTPVRKRRWGSEETTKKCVSFPLHEENLIDDWKKLAALDYVSESQYVRKLIREQANRKLRGKTTETLEVIGV
tara:strand:- start:883 stop:1107 length:225 start_codon:yes stop_codon:yes gene_type:complete